jgi:hypothetical protein
MLARRANEGCIWAPPLYKVISSLDLILHGSIAIGRDRSSSNINRVAVVDGGIGGVDVEVVGHILIQFLLRLAGAVDATTTYSSLLTAPATGDGVLGAFGALVIGG